jgi:hypothetical protein
MLEKVLLLNFSALISLKEVTVLYTSAGIMLLKQQTAETAMCAGTVCFQQIHDFKALGELWFMLTKATRKLRRYYEC